MGAQTAPPFVVARDITKSFGGAQALKGVSLDIVAGEVHGLVGANGAGKSTLIRILAGLVQPDRGTIEVDGRPVSIETPHQRDRTRHEFHPPGTGLHPRHDRASEHHARHSEAHRASASSIGAAIARDVAPIAARVGITAPLGASVKGLSTAENWLINICRALVRKARLIVMDEPTASLSASESERLFAIVRDLSASGVSVLYVSHRLDEILDLCDRVTVFRDGRSVREFGGATSRARARRGDRRRQPAEHSRVRHSAAGRKVVLRVEGLARAAACPRRVLRAA